MDYKFCANENFEDYASGRVLCGGRGIPNFPVRLLNEIFRRCLSYREIKTGLTVYDPCCGGGYSLTVLGMCNNGAISTVLGSDIDPQMTETARKNTGLLTQPGLQERIDEIEALHHLYGKDSHREALESAERIRNALRHEIPSRIFEADCTAPLNINEKVDVILTDIPYGNLVSWQGGENSGISAMMYQLAEIAQPDTILAISMDRHEKPESDEWHRCEKNLIGKRKFEIYRLNG